MRRLLVLLLMLVLITSVAFAGGRREREYPSRDITNVLVWGAGGGTDMANRLVMAEMARILGTNINVINVTGGVSGSMGMIEGFNRPADGYTLVGISESIVTAGVQGGFRERMDVWDYFIIGGSPGVISVGADSPFHTIEDLVAAARANPGTIRAGGSAAGSIHHLNLIGFENGTGVRFNFIPYTSSAESQNAVLTGEVQIVCTTVQEQSELIRAGMLRPLAVVVPNDFNFGGMIIPSAFRSFPELARHLPLEQQIGFAIRRDAPEAVKTVLRDAFKQAMQAESVVNFGRERYFTLRGYVGQQANDIFDVLESRFSWMLWDLGAAQVNPATLGIPRL